MMDSVMTTGLLHRLDALAAQMDVTASELWGLWLATWWRSALPLVALVPVCLAAYLTFRYCGNQKAKDKYGDWEFGQWSALVVLAAVGAITLLVIGDVVVYAVEPRLYALDQFRGLFQ